LTLQFGAGIASCCDFLLERLLASDCVVPVDGVRLQVLFPAQFTIAGTGPQDQKEISMVALDAVVAADRELKEQEHENIVPLPAGGVDVWRIAESTFHRSPVTRL
jgi:hypothetical protein